MSVFNYYSEYYDLLYKEKDYESEVSYIIELIEEFRPGAKSIIDFGCGTGSHDIIFAEKGFKTLGLDLSPGMIEIANNKCPTENPSFEVGDIRDFQTDRKFDVAVSLFHVISYQVTNNDLVKSFKTINTVLNVGDIFIFDFWFGPGVLHDQPNTRIKRLENEKIKVTRLTESTIFPNENKVDVNFEVLVEKKSTNERYEINEVHSMRYLFYPELEYLLYQSGFEVLNLFEWMKFENPSLDSWNAVIVSRKMNG